MAISELITYFQHELEFFLTWTFFIYYGIILIVSWQFFKLVVRPLLSPLLKQLPHRPFRPIVGNFVEIARDEAIATYSRWIEEHDSSVIVYHGMLGSVRIMVADPDFMKHILVTNSRNYKKPTFLFARLKEIIGNGLVTSEGNIHAAHRKLINGSFRVSILQNFVPILEKYATEMCDQWVEKIDNNPGELFTVISPTESLTCMALDAIGDCAFGYKFNSLKTSQAKDVMAFQRILGVFGFSWKLLIPYITKLPTVEKRQWDSDMSIINSCVSTLIATKNKLLSSITDADNVSDLLTSLLLAKDEETGVGLSDRDVRDHVLTFLVAGHETTSSALLWCLLSLSRHPDIQDKLRAEIGSLDGDLTWESLEQLPYLNAVAKETLRLYPPVSLTFREAMESDQFNGVVIPKGTVLNLTIGAIQRHPQFWDDPLTFNPDRFLSKEGPTPYTYLPFLAGPRMCIGYKFALMEMKVTIAILLRKLSFLPLPDMTYRQKQRITMRPSPNLELRVSKLN